MMAGRWPMCGMPEFVRPLVAVLLLIGAGIVGLPGCGASYSQSDMRRYAIRRSSSDEGEGDQERTPPKAAAARANKTPSATAAPARPEPTAQTSAAHLPAAGTGPATSAKPLPDDGPLADTQSPPAVPLDQTERAKRTVDNLTRIGEAFEAHLEKKGVYPARAVFDSSGEPLLSWRVVLLPYLGYERLYAQFHLDEPWNSRHNYTLLSQIPSVFQSPERFDERTNYLVPVASGTAFRRNRGVHPRHFEDGVSNTVIVLEADDALAVSWTEPRDYALDFHAPTNLLGALRDGAMYVVWGSGDVGRVLTSAPLDALRAMYTYDGGEDFTAGRIDQPLFPPLAVTGGPEDPSTAQADAAGTPNRVENDSASAAGADAAASSLAADYLNRSHEALSLGQERGAMQWFYAAVVVGAPSSQWADYYRWVPALRRPTPIVRIGIGLQYSGPREETGRLATKPAANRLSPPSPMQTWTTVTGELGRCIVKVLSSHRQHSDGSLIGGLPTQPRRPPLPQSSLLYTHDAAPIAPGVCLLGVARDSVLRRVAHREAVDVLLVVDWRETSNDRWSVGMRLVDVVRDEKLVSFDRIDRSQWENAMENPLADNPVAATLRQVTDYLNEQLAMEPLPEQIKPRHVAGRLEVLAATEEASPLRALAEMRYYHARGLADRDGLLVAYQALLGRRPGIELMLGDAEAKQRVVQPWLPSPTMTDGPGLWPTGGRQRGFEN